MRRFFTRFFSFLMTFLLSALVSVSAVMCFAETFKLGSDPAKIIPACCGTAFLAALSMLPRRRWIVVTAEAVLLTVIVWRNWDPLWRGLRKILYNVTIQYAKDFPVDVIGSAGGNTFWCLLLMGVLIAWTTAWVCGGKGSGMPVALICTPVFVSCLLIVDLAPVLWLVLLTGALLLLLVTQSVRSRDSDQGNRLAWLLLAPTGLLVAAVVFFSPPEEYVRTDWVDVLREMAEGRLDMEGPAIATPVSGVSWNRQLETVNLRWLGPKTLTGAHALDFRATTSISYLRGVSLGVYENNAWSAVESSAFANEQFSKHPQLTGSIRTGILEVRTDSRKPLLYTTYYLSEIPDGVTAVDDAYLENSRKVTEYAVDYSGLAATPTRTYDGYVAENYLQLPQELREPLAQYIRENGLSGGSPQAIARRVQQSGEYDLDTPRTPLGEDFVLYFLNESHRGYCVHFASATVLLLRAEGIPARYVSGYSVSGTPGEWSEVTEDEAHAWVEYYQEGVGWRTLDPTPASWRTATNEPASEPDTPEEPQPPEAEDEPPEEEPQSGETPPAEEPTLPGKDTPAVNMGTETAPGASDGKIFEAVKSALRQILRWLLPALTAFLLLALRRWLVVRRRHKRCTGQHPNRCLLAYWRWLERLTRASGRKPDPPLLTLAEKARFSQHTIREDELAQLRQAVDEEIKLLEKGHALKRLWYQYGLVLY